MLIASDLNKGGNENRACGDLCLFFIFSFIMTLCDTWSCFQPLKQLNMVCIVDEKERLRSPVG